MKKLLLSIALALSAGNVVGSNIFDYHMKELAKQIEQDKIMNYGQGAEATTALQNDQARFKQLMAKPKGELSALEQNEIDALSKKMGPRLTPNLEPFRGFL